MSSEELTREEFMVACKADGTEESVCAARWEAAHAANPSVTPAKTSPGDVKSILDEIKTLRRENAMLRGERDTRTKQLRQAVDIAGRANDLAKARDEEEKQRLVNSIQLDSKGFTKDELTKKDLSELQIIRTTLDKSLIKDFASVAAEIDAAKKSRKPHLTAGYYDSATQTWKGGI
jgi:hypothetical protein